MNGQPNKSSGKIQWILGLIIVLCGGASLVLFFVSEFKTMYLFICIGLVVIGSLLLSSVKKTG
ncbi:MAG: hypothetical protein Q8867_02005 [Bacteroidota bacterium]|nr:hypothetical protein [Bacteroidota bacterium]